MQFRSVNQPLSLIIRHIDQAILDRERPVMFSNFKLVSVFANIECRTFFFKSIDKPSSLRFVRSDIEAV